MEATDKNLVAGDDSGFWLNSARGLEMDGGKELMKPTLVSLD